MNTGHSIGILSNCLSFGMATVLGGSYGDWTDGFSFYAIPAVYVPNPSGQASLGMLL